MKSLLTLLASAFLLLAVIVTLTNCSEEDPAKPSVAPTVTTAEADEITQTSAVAGGTISDDGGAPVTQRGVCWSTSPAPTTSDSKTVDGTGTGSYTSELTGLTLNTTYYLRAYATNSVGTSYGTELNFTTLDIPLTDGLMAYWNLDAATGETAADDYGNWDLAFVNGPEWFTPGKRGSSIDFGTESIRYLERTGVNSGGKNTYSMTAWIYLQENVADLKYIMGMNSGGSAEGAGAAEVKMYLDNGNHLVGMYHPQNGALHNTVNVMQRTSGATIPLNQWVFVAAVINNGTVDLYINGAPDTANAVESSGLSGPLNFSSGRVTIGNARLHTLNYVSTRWFRGRIDEAGIWGRALRAKDVESLYDAGEGLEFPE